MKILAHRGLLSPKEKTEQNKITTLINAINNNFDFEFDINLSLDCDKFVLSHDPINYHSENSFNSFFEIFPKKGFHALNIKNLSTLTEIKNKIEENNIKENFFLFDFELLSSSQETLNIMKELTDDEFHVAYRLSEKEPFFEDYLKDSKVNILWLDEFSEYWLNEKHIKLFSEKGKKTYYVSPDLHGNHNLDFLKKKWEYFYNAGITGICTDYALELKKFIGESND